MKKRLLPRRAVRHKATLPSSSSLLSCMNSADAMASIQPAKVMDAYQTEEPVGQDWDLLRHPWKSHFFGRLPYDALGAILVAIGCVIAMVLVTQRSNGDLIENWPVSPGVYLALISVIANVVVRYTFSRGVEISWWVTAMKEGTTVKDLHNIWSFGTSLLACVLAGRHFNLVSLAAILLALVPANAPLAQRASRPVTRTVSSGVNIPIKAIQALDWKMATGQITGRGHAVSFVNADFASVLQHHLSSAPIQIEDSPCRGTCRGILQAAGYEMSCVNDTAFFNKTSPDDLDGTTVFNPVAVFQTTFSYGEAIESSVFKEGRPIMTLNTTHKDYAGCAGDLKLRNCTLVPATLEYHILVNNGTIILDSDYTYKDDKVVKYVTTESMGTQVGSTIHGGIALALSSMFNSVVTLRWAGTIGNDMTTSGITALRYVRQPENREAGASACGNSWFDPTDDLLMAARDIMFRLALEGNQTGVDVQSISTSQQGSEVVYSSDFLFLGLAILLIGLSVVANLPLLLHWWRLGRPVSLSPIEVARAFAAPELAGSGSNSDTSQLMKEVGSRTVRYGAVDYHGENGHLLATELAVANPDVVRPPQNGVRY